MCGICGIVSDNHNIIGPSLDLMNRAIMHRGPDDEGQYLNNNFGMGMRRLSIIDLETGHQPMFSADKRLVIVFNGEIYNYRDLKQKYLNDYQFASRSDTEVVLYLFHKMGEKCLDLLQGIFAFAIYNSESKELFIARDHMGVKPLCYYSDDHTFLFSSDIISFHEIPFIDLTVNIAIINEYLRYGYVPHPYTIFNKVLKLRAGQFMKINSKAEIIIHQYYKFWENLNSVDNIWHDNTKEKLQKLIFKSVSDQMISDVPLGSFLSGGIDSSIVSVEMASASKEPVNTFTIGFYGASNRKDLELSSLLSSTLNSNHHERIIEPEMDKVLDYIIESMGEPFAITSTIPVYINSKIAREEVKVVLSGDGADEVFGGYGRYDHFFRLKNMEWMRFLPLSFINDLSKELTNLLKISKLNKAYLLRVHPFLTFLTQPDDYQRYLLFAGATNDKIIKDIMQPQYFGLNSVSSNAYDFLKFSERNGHNLNSLMAFDVHTSLVDEMLTKVDFASMLASLEVRVPFLDRRIVEFGLSMPVKYKINHLKNKLILREAYSDRLPPEIMNAHKRGFNVPLDNWIRNSWSASFKTIFNSPLLIELGIDTVALNHLFNKYLAGYPISGKIFYYIFILTSWYEKLKQRRSFNEI
jgi:asparagine synthase (glutamine-hydrolysing)